MHIKHLKIVNYKSFFHPTEMYFEPGFNVLLGANSSGKSSVLEAITLHMLADIPHLSTLTVEEPGRIPAGRPSIELSLSLSATELLKLTDPGQDFHIGLGDQLGHFYSANLEQISTRLVNEVLEFGIKRDMSRDHVQNSV
jgi:hypothetical protein